MKFCITSLFLIKSFFLFSTEVSAGLSEGAELREVLIAQSSLNADTTKEQVISLLLQKGGTAQDLRAITPTHSDTPEVAAAKIAMLRELQTEFQTEIDELEPEIEQVKQKNGTSWKTITAVTIPTLLCSVLSGELGVSGSCSIAQYAMAFSVGFWVYGVGEQAVHLIYRKVVTADPIKRYNARVSARDRITHLLTAHSSA